MHMKVRSASTPILSLLVVLVVGYIGVQSEGMLNGYLFDFGGIPAVSITRRFPWELQFATILISFAAVVAYRRIALDRGAKLWVLAALVMAAVLSVVFYETIHTTRTSLLAMAFINGGVSPLTMGLIAAVSADIIHSKRHVVHKAA
jgi:Na+/melibiose symporter-like transporter